jgi:hypothetical protein
MFVHRMRGVATATLLGALSLAVGACDDPGQSTDLRPEGPPEVLTVLVFTDAVNGVIEQATYCKPNDEKRPGLVGTPLITTEEVCPEDLSASATPVTNAYPDGWYVRIMFDELLNPDIETLTPVVDEETGEATGQFVGSIATTHPVKLECESVNGGMVEVDYDGYYSPAGNRITWPVGPSLVIKPNDPTLIATNSACQVTILDVVVDKTGEQVAAGDRGPYKFNVAPITVLMTDPADGDEIDAAATYVDGIYVLFNTEVDPTSVCDEGTAMDECEVTFTPDEGGVDFDAGGTEYFFYTANPSHVETDYVFSFVAGTKLKDRCGKETTLGAPSEDDGTIVNFTTHPFDLNTPTIASGETSSAMKKLSLPFSNVIALASLTTSEYSITPAPLTPTTSSPNTNDIRFNGFFKINTDYTFTLNAGATVEDAYGVVYTNPEALTITWKTQPKITLAISPKEGSVIEREAATDEVEIDLSFNSAIKDGEITEGTDFTVTGSSGASTGWTATLLSCGATSTSCTIALTNTVPDGTYTLTIKAGATATDQNGDVYTQAADQVVHFTVETTPPGTAPACL